MRKAMLFISLIVISGCASHLNLKNTSTEYGEYPKNYSEIVKSHYQTIAGDPDSIHFNAIHIPRSFSVPDGPWQAKHGYIVCADLNYKAPNGEYTGHHTDGLLINNGRVVQFIERGQWLGESVC